MLDPLTQQQDKLANFHANTQVPKLIGLARLHELTGKPAQATAARFFFDTVTQHHSYVIGGNSDREYFSTSDTVADHITEPTCEHCNTYDVLKLARQLYSWQPDGALFDYCERAHLNHVMSAQNPKTAGFTYMTPLMTGIERGYSTVDDDAFWCCVGSGMEFGLKVKPGPLILQATYRGDERKRNFDILIDNVEVATQHLEIDKPGKFMDVEYPLPEALTKGKKSVCVRFVPHDRSSAGPVFGVRLFTAKPAATA